MTIAADASALSTILSTTVYYGFTPDEADGSLDTLLSLVDYPSHPPTHEFGQAMPAFTPYGITVWARAATQADARTLCDSGYSALLAMGYLAISPTMSMGRDDVGRWIAAAQVEAVDISGS